MMSKRQVWTSVATALIVWTVTGTVHASSAAQTAIPVEVPDWLAGFGLGVVVLYIVLRIVTTIGASRVPAGTTEALNKLADNQAEAIKLDRERFEAQKIIDSEHNKKILTLMEMSRVDHERMHNSEAAHARLVGEEILAKHKLAESISAMNTEDARHNLEIETRVTNIENTLGQVQADINIVKRSVGPNAAAKLEGVERAFTRLSDEFHALRTALEESKQNEAITEGKPNEQVPISVTNPDPVLLGAAPSDAGAGTDDRAGADGGLDTGNAAQ